MQITIVQGAFLPVPPVAGGAVEKLWMDLGAEFARRGLGVTHLSRTWPGLQVEETVRGVRYRRLGGFDFPASSLLAKVLDLIYSVRCLAVLGRSDVIVTNTFFMPLLLRLMPRRGALYVSVHRYPKGQIAWYGNAARIQCVSTAVADVVRQQAPGVAAQVKVVPNYVSSGCSLSQFEAGWDTRRKEVLFVGRIHPEKGLDLLIEAYARIDASAREGWRLRVVGPHATSAGGGGDRYLDQLRRKARALDVDVDWAGAIYDKAALDACYARAGLFVYPSIATRGEAFGLAPLEAMAQGCAVVTSDLSCFLDFVDPGGNADVFEIGDDAVERLAGRLAALMDDAPRRRRYALAAFATVERFSLARVADAFVEDFHELTSA